MVKEVVLLSSLPLHGDLLQQRQQVLGSRVHGLWVDGAEVPVQDLIKPFC